MVFRQTIVLGTAGWTIPSAIASKNIIIFGDWDSSNAIIQYDASTSTLRSSVDGVSMTVYIFATAPSLTIPDYGITMYNESGSMTFSSENPPICYPNNEVSIDASFKTLPFTDSLVQITDCGYIVATSTGNVWIYNVGLVKYGNQIKAATGTLASHFNTKIGTHAYDYPAIRLITINKSTYNI